MNVKVVVVVVVAVLDVELVVIVVEDVEVAVVDVKSGKLRDKSIVDRKKLMIKCNRYRYILLLLHIFFYCISLYFIPSSIYKRKKNTQQI